MRPKTILTKEKIEKAIENTTCMSAAASYLNVHFNTFKKWAVEYDLYNPNMAGRGLSKKKREGHGKIPLQEIFEGKHPQYQTFKLKRRLFEEGLKTNYCEVCGLSEWLGKPINCELDHINGKRTDHRLENLRILCPNCHSQTETFRSKNRKPL